MKGINTRVKRRRRVAAAHKSCCVHRTLFTPALRTQSLKLIRWVVRTGKRCVVAYVLSDYRAGVIKVEWNGGGEVGRKSSNGVVNVGEVSFSVDVTAVRFDSTPATEERRW